MKYLKIKRNQLLDDGTAPITGIEYIIDNDTDLYFSMSDNRPMDNNWEQVHKIPTSGKYMVLLRTFVGFHEDTEIIKSKKYNEFFERILTDLKNDRCMLVTWSNDFTDTLLILKTESFLKKNNINPKNFVTINMTYISNIEQYNMKHKVLFLQHFFGIQDTLIRSFQNEIDEDAYEDLDLKGLRPEMLTEFSKRLFLNQLKYKRPNKFISYNGSPRHHRIYLLKFLYENNLLKHGIYSFFATSHCNLNREDVVHTIEEYVDKDTEIYNKIMEIIPISLDNLPNEYGSWGEDVNLQAHYSSYLEIVAETTWDQLHDSCTLTEKTGKPLFTGLPFILLARPYGLKLLKQYGFKTFHPFIDESYDDVIDCDKRLEMIFNEIKRILNMNEEEIHKWFLSMKGILYHNIKHFHSFIYKNQIDIKCGIEESWNVFNK
jgi:hypothetical protein|tara:strand:+ start:3561 stop:4853 length:1293 start_codon:yes stop_codon:yes gene_type:complete